MLTKGLRPARTSVGRGALCVALALLANSGCAPRRAPAPQEVKVAFATAPLSFDPHATDEIVAFVVNSSLYDTLVTTDADLHPEPGLAESWFNPDLRTWVFDLRPGLRFQDGSPLTSLDVAFSIKRAWLDPRSQWGGGLLSLESVEAPTAARVILKTRAPDATLIQSLAQTFVVPRTSGAIEGSSLASRPVGSGPYRLESWDPVGGRTVLASWEGYRGPPPAIRRVVLTAVGDDSERVKALIGRRFDLVSDVPPDLGSRVASSPGVKLLEVHGLTEIYLAFDVSRRRTPYASPATNPFAERRVRRAFDLAIDREALVKDVLLGAGEVSNEPVAPSVFGFDPGLKPSAPNPELARHLLKEAGFGNGFSVVLDAGASSFNGDVRVAPYVARALSAVGVTVEVRTYPKAVLFARQERGDTSLTIAGWNCASGDLQEVLDFMLHSPDPSRGYGRENIGRYRNPILDALAEQAHQTFDRGRRLDLLRTAARAAAEDLPVVPLYVTRERYGAVQSLDFSPRPDRLIRFSSLQFSGGSDGPSRRATQPSPED